MDDYFNSKEFKENLRRYEASRNSDAPFFMDADDMVDIAEYYHGLGRNDEALRVCDEALEIFPDATGPMVMKARAALVMDNDPDKCERILNKVNDKNDLDYHYAKAELMITRHQEQAAQDYLIGVYDHSVDEDDKPDYVLDVAELMVDYGLLDYAQYWLGLSDESELDDYQEIKGRIAMGDGRYHDSERIFNHLVDKNPYSTGYWNNLSASQYMLGNIQDSISSSEFSIAINPSDADALLGKANGLYSLGNYEDALEYYRRYTKVGDKWLGIAFQGVTCLALEHNGRGLDLLKYAATNCPDSDQNKAEILRQLANALSMTGHTDEAIEWINRMMLLPEVDESQILVFKGYIYLSAKRTREARECFHEAVSKSRSRQDTVTSISIALHDCGHYKEAYTLQKFALERFHDGDANYGYAFLADSCRHIGKNQEFTKYLKMACRLCPEEVEQVFGDDIPADIEPKDYWKLFEDK